MREEEEGGGRCARRGDGEEAREEKGRGRLGYGGRKDTVTWRF